VIPHVVVTSKSLGGIYGSQIMKGKFVLGQSLFGIPFLLGTLVFGRTTYEMMASFWPTPAAAEQFPEVARNMNSRPKVVFSKTLQKASWVNTTIVKDDPALAIKKMKNEPGDTLVIMGSGSIVSQLSSAGLIDEFQIMVLPVVLGAGKTMFDGANKMLNMTLTNSRTFKNGKAFLVYKPKASSDRA